MQKTSELQEQTIHEKIRQIGLEQKKIVETICAHHQEVEEDLIFHVKTAKFSQKQSVLEDFSKLFVPTSKKVEKDLIFHAKTAK